MGENAKTDSVRRKAKRNLLSKLNLKSSASLLFDRLARTASDMWNASNDPFQVFEVEHESCLDLTITVRGGDHITKGFYKDLIDIPDPYVILRVPGSSNSSKRTSHVDNSATPEWNETFHFFLDPKKKHTLQVTLMDANHLQDEVLGMDELDINMIVQNCAADFSFEFEGGSKIYTTMTLQKNKTPDLRFSLSLCEEEKCFLRERRQKVLSKMQKIIGEAAPKSKDEVPIIAVMGSGGGFRAMICLSAATKALYDSGILGCSTYITGLSGSSWFISTLYANDNLPNTTFEEVYEDLKQSVTSNWKWNLMHSHRYILSMLEKKRRGQPVSFTDIFGHLLGDVLLKDNKNKKLSDQRHILKKGKVPLPLYTCLHAKAAVSCRAFSEWIEFSPFEIGIAKYGTFMKAEHFGSKFLVGKMIKQYPEFPLHYLQGVWGSAFTILMKRVAFDGGSKQDIVQMMRDANEERAINEKLEEENMGVDTPERESETDDDADVEGADDKSEEEETEDCKKQRTLEEEKERLREILGEESEDDETDDFFPKSLPRKLEKQKSVVESPKTDSDNKRVPVQFSFDFENKRKKEVAKDLALQEQKVKQRAGSVPNIASAFTSKMNLSEKRERLQRKGAIKGTTCKEESYWSSRRNRRRTQKARKSSIFQNLMQKTGVLDSRAGRAGEILNPFRGLSLKNSFPLSPFAFEDETDFPDEKMDIGMGCRYEPLDNTAKRLFIVDSGLAFNSPYPLLLRPQRAVDMYLSFDFSQRASDSSMPFKELLLAEKWANQNQVSFPPIQKLVDEFSKDEEVKELYVFKDLEDPFCPVILHFTIVNNKFRHYKAPGELRTTEEEREFANFSLFDDPAQPYVSTNFVYEPLQFERLFKLVEFNTLLHIDTIKQEMEEMVAKKRKMMIKRTQKQFQKMADLLKSCHKFQNLRKGLEGGMSLRLNEHQTKKMLMAGGSLSISSREPDDDEEFLESLDNLSDFDSDNESEFVDAGNDQSDFVDLQKDKEEEEKNQKDYPDIPPEKKRNQKDYPDIPPEKKNNQEDYPDTPPEKEMNHKDYPDTPPEKESNQKDYPDTPPVKESNQKDYPVTPPEKEITTVTTDPVAMPKEKTLPNSRELYPPVEKKKIKMVQTVTAVL